ncbi:ABC transporter ATP-binding domain-containing protein (plasmid) [Rhizobium sp. NXC14]|nr:ABC transporter ATP-binding domain-containing protein [Rhizobium sp. NXC14]
MHDIRRDQRYKSPLAGQSLKQASRRQRRFPPQTLRKEIAIVPQEVTMFAASVYDNIALGRPALSSEAWRN